MPVHAAVFFRTIHTARSRGIRKYFSPFTTQGKPPIFMVLIIINSVRNFNNWKESEDNL